MNINYADSCNFKPIPAITPLDGYWQNGTWKFNMPEITAGASSQPSWQDIVLSGNGSLTLTNAKENGLNYLKLFGGTEQRNLPEGYTEYNGLIGDGTAYIDLDCTLDQNDEIELEFTMPATGMNSINIFGYRNSASSQAITAMIASSNTNLFISDFNNSDYNTYRLASVSPLSVSTRYKLILNKTGRYLYQDSTLVASNTTACPDTILTGNAYLFNVGGTPAYTNKFSGTIHRCLIKGKRDVVPAGNGTAYGVYDKLNGVFYPNANTGGSFTVGNAIVPSPDTPMGIVSNNGTIKVNTNLYWTEYNGYELSQVDGVTLRANSGVDVSGMVDCKTIKSFKITTISPQGSFRIFKYRADNTFIDANSTANIGDIITLEDNVDFFRIQYNFTNGGTGTQNILIYDSAYNLNGIYTDGTVETVEVTGKNLFDKAQTPYKSSYYVANTTVVGSNIVTSQNSNYNIYKIEVRQNTTYTFGKIKATNPSWAVVDSNDIVLQTGINDGGTEGRDITITTDATAKYLYLSVAVSGTYKCDDVLQLELGSTATTYEPYFNGGSATAEMLLKVSTYQDVQSVLDGGITRNVGIKVLDGTESWTVATTNVLQADVLPNNTYGQTCICSHLEYTTSATFGNMPDNSFKNGSNTYQNRLYVKSLTLATDSTTWTNFLASQYANGTPVIIVYPLATPTTETVTAQPLSIQAGSNIVEITQASINNLPLEVSYKGVI